MTVRQIRKKLKPNYLKYKSMLMGVFFLHAALPINRDKQTKKAFFYCQLVKV